MSMYRLPIVMEMRGTRKVYRPKYRDLLNNAPWQLVNDVTTLEEIAKDMGYVTVKTKGDMPVSAHLQLASMPDVTVLER